MNDKVLASRLNNRIEIHREQIVQGELGDKREYKLYKKVWADIIPLSANSITTSEDFEYTDTKFKIIMRKTDITQADIIYYKGTKYEISHIIPSFNKNNYIEIHCTLKKEFYGEL